MSEKREACSQSNSSIPILQPSFIAPEAVRRGQVRLSRVSKIRAWVLTGVYLASFGHLLHWQLKGETLSPLEPSEAMYTMARGVVNAGAILLVASLAVTLVVGRWFCGWLCHMVAVQDLAAWILKKVGIKPRPVRSRLLIWVPLLAGLYMFIIGPLWSRHAAGTETLLPEFTMGLTKRHFWETFPGIFLSVLTLVVCGGLMIYVLGSKSFCFYGCPYGGLFSVVDRFAPGRIRVTDACKACGHCTAVCTSNVDVASEVLNYGTVVNPDCMKCADCISVCPENALYFGFGKPSAFTKAKRPAKPKAVDFIGIEEIGLALGFGAALLVFVGLPNAEFPWATSLYGQTPLLFALGLSAMTAFSIVICIRLARRTEVKLQNLVLKAAADGGKARLTRSGKTFVILLVPYLLFFELAAVTQIFFWRGEHAQRAIDVGRFAWTDKSKEPLPADVRAAALRAESSYAVAQALSFGIDPRVPSRRAGIAQVLGDTPTAVRHMERALAMDPEFAPTHYDLAQLLVAGNRVGEAIEHLIAAIKLDRENIEYENEARRLGVALMQSGMMRDSAKLLRGLAEIHPDDPMIFQALAIALSAQGDAEGAARADAKARSLAPTSQPSK